MEDVVAAVDTINSKNTGEENARVEGCDKAYRRLDFQTAMMLCRPLAEKGNAVAQARLGDMYSSLTSVPYPTRDYTEAAKWYRKAAELGLAYAQKNLGSFYKSGIGVEKNYEKAFEWGLRAANQGVAAHWFISDLYKDGIGVRQNYEESYFWLLIAIQIEPGVNSRSSSDVVGYLTAEQRASVKKRVAEWKAVAPDNASEEVIENWRKVVADRTNEIKDQSRRFSAKAEEGYPAFQIKMGDYYEVGNGVPHDLSEAAKWYRRAANQADVVGQWRLAEMYQTGSGVEQNWEEAYFWYSLAIRLDGRLKHSGANSEIEKVATHLSSEQKAGIDKRVAGWTHGEPEFVIKQRQGSKLK